MSDHEGIRRLMAEYAQAVESVNIDAIVACFSEDCELIVRGQTYRGHAGVRENYGTRLDPAAPPVLHAPVNTIIDVQGERATARGPYILVRLDEASGTWPVQSAGSYDDVMVKQSGRWRFQRRVVSPGRTQA